jgi:hypothetical protein
LRCWMIVRATTAAMARPASQTRRGSILGDILWVIGTDYCPLEIRAVIRVVCSCLGTIDLKYYQTANSDRRLYSAASEGM